MNDHIMSRLRQTIRSIACMLPVVLLLACAGRFPNSLPAAEVAFQTPHAPSPTATPLRAAASDSPTPAPTPFTVVWFPDTQSSAYAAPESLEAMGDWVAGHIESDNIVYVLQTGDLVDNGFVEKQWKHFELAYDRFAGRVPYFCIAGNHDLGVKRHEWDGYLARPYAHTVPKVQEFAGGKAAYTLFSAGGVDFLVVGIGDGAEKDAAAWARQMFDRYPDRYGILMLHGFLHGRGDIPGKSAQIIYDRVIARCANVRMTLNGHYRGTAYRALPFDDNADGVPDRTVHSFLCNYQHYMENGGQIRLLRFDPAENRLTVHTFSSVNGHGMRDATMKQVTFTIADIF